MLLLSAVIYIVKNLLRIYRGWGYDDNRPISSQGVFGF